MKALYC